MTAQENSENRWNEAHASLYRMGYVGQYALLSSDALMTALDAYDRGLRGQQIDALLRPEYYN